MTSGLYMKSKKQEKNGTYSCMSELHSQKKIGNRRNIQQKYNLSFVLKNIFVYTNSIPLQICKNNENTSKKLKCKRNKLNKTSLEHH